MATEARYPIQIDSNAAQVATEGATALEQLRAKLEESKAAAKSYSSQLRDLTGDSKEVVDAKKELVDKINAEKTAISQGQLELLKAGTSYDKLAASHKKLVDDKKKLTDQTAKAASSAKAEATATDTLKGSIDSATAATLAFDAAEALATAGVGVLVGAVVTAAAAVPALTGEFAKFALTNANTLRTQQLTREAFVGSAEDATHLKNQIEDLGKRVPSTRAELNAMATDLAQSGVKGSALVDTLAAVSEETGGLNQKAGDKIKELLTRNAQWGNFALGQLELQGTGLKFGDVAKALAKDTKTSVAEASTALMQGRVTMAAGAQAMKEAVEAKFGGLNLKKMLDLDVMSKKFEDTLQSLTKDIHLDGLLKSIGSLGELFDQSNESGAALKEIVTFLGQGTVDSLGASTPAIKDFIETLELGALDLELDYLDLKIQFLETFGSDTLDKVDAFKLSMGAAGGVVRTLGDNAELAILPVKTLVDEMFRLKNLAEHPSKSTAAGAFTGAARMLNPAIAAGNALGIPGFAEGLERVPSDNFLARLHKGERVLTRDEADAYRRIEQLSAQRGGGGTTRSSGGNGGGHAIQPHISVTVQASERQAAPLEQVRESARRGTLEALEIFARQRGLVIA